MVGAGVVTEAGGGGVVGWKIPGTIGNCGKKGNGYCGDWGIWGNWAGGAAGGFIGGTGLGNRGYWGNCGYCGMNENAGCWAAGDSWFPVSVEAPEGSCGCCGKGATVPGGYWGNTGNWGYWGYCKTGRSVGGAAVVVVVGLMFGDEGHVTKSSTSASRRDSKYFSSCRGRTLSKSRSMFTLQLPYLTTRGPHHTWVSMHWPLL